MHLVLAFLHYSGAKVGAFFTEQAVLITFQTNFFFIVYQGDTVFFTQFLLPGMQASQLGKTCHAQSPSGNSPNERDDEAVVL